MKRSRQSQAEYEDAQAAHKKATHHTNIGTRAKEQAYSSAQRADSYADQAATSASRANSAMTREQTHAHLRQEHANLSNCSDLIASYRSYVINFVKTVSAQTHVMDENERTFYQSLFENVARPMAVAARKKDHMYRRKVLDALNATGARIRRDCFHKSMPEIIRPWGLSGMDTTQADAEALFGEWAEIK